MNSFFYKNIITNQFSGGGAALIGSIINTSFNCFVLCSCGGTGFGIYQFSSVNNYLNQSVFFQTYYIISTSCSSWCLRGGFSISNSINSSNGINIYRESCGHFGWQPLCYSIFIQNNNNNGLYIFNPSSKSPEGIHEFTNYINNTAINSLILFNSYDKLKNNIFIKNIGILTSGTSNGLFENCFFDSNFSGIMTNTINCFFLQNNLIEINIKISNSYCLKNQNLFTLMKKINNNFLIFIFYIFE